MRRLGIVIGLLLAFAAAFGQSTDSSTRSKWWIDAFLGQFSASKGINGDTYGVGLTVFDNKFFYTGKIVRNQEPRDFLFIEGPLPHEGYTSVDLTIGKGISKKYFLFHFSGGLGITTGIKRGAFIKTEPTFFGSYDVYEKDRFTAPSIPLELELMFKPTRWLGLGFGCFGNLNTVRSYGGGAFKLSLGRLR